MVPRNQLGTLLIIASALAERAAEDHSSAEKILSATLENWQHASLTDPPPGGLKLLARRGGAVIVADLSSEGSSVLVADSDERQTVAAIARIVPETIVFEPPAARARAIADYLASHFGKHIQRASTIQAEYVNGSNVIAFEASDPLLEDEAGPSLREALVLAHRYRCNFYHGPLDDVLQRLATLRVKWLDALSVRLGGVSEPVPMFDRRAVLLREPAGQVLLVPEHLKGNRSLLFSIAEALGEAVGSRKNIGEPLLALAAALQQISHPPDGVRTMPACCRCQAPRYLACLARPAVQRAAFGALLLPFVYLHAGPAVC